jgi:hypothetical protein
MNKMKTYLMFDGNLYKIGKSNNPEKRLKQLKTANPNIQLLAITEKITEDFLHNQFNEYRVTGEWFLFDEVNLKQVLSYFTIKFKEKQIGLNNKTQQITMSDNFIPIKKAIQLTGKSESTLRNLGRKLKTEKSENINLERLPTGHEKILFNEKFIKSYFIREPINENKQIEDNKIIEILTEQLTIKNEQIERLNNLLLEAYKVIKINAENKLNQSQVITENKNKNFFRFW